MEAAASPSTSLSAAVARVVVGDDRWSSMCNCVVNFLLEEKYHLTAFELMQELTEDGRHDHAIRLRNFFSDSSLFPPDHISRLNALSVADPHRLLEEKQSTEEKLALTDYELRLAQEDLSLLKSEIQKLKELPTDKIYDASEDNGSKNRQNERSTSLSSLGTLKDSERKDLNCAVKEYLLFAGYRLTAMTFIEEVVDQDLNIWSSNSACVSDALRRYYYQYISSTSEAAEEKIQMLQENERLLRENERIDSEKDSLIKNKEVMISQITKLKTSLELVHKELKERDKSIQGLKQLTDAQRKEVNDCRAEITALKMHIEGTRSSKGWTLQDGENAVPTELRETKKIVPLDHEIEKNIVIDSVTSKAEAVFIGNPVSSEKADENAEVARVPVIEENCNLSNGESPVEGLSENEPKSSNGFVTAAEISANGQAASESKEISNNILSLDEQKGLHDKLGSPIRGRSLDKVLETIEILSDSLPKIVPYVLINHREELLPLIMCAIERHPVSTVRDSLTHTLFNLIKRPDEQQRRIIMDACVNLAKNVGEMRTETELLPQCWEQINHQYEERRLLVAQSCGQLAEYVRPEIRDSLILSIVQQLVEDSATVVREAAVLNLALLLPLFPNSDKYFKVEELMFQLVCDPSGVVVDSAIKELVPAVIKWGGKLEQVLRILLSHMLASAQRCPPLSGVEGSLDSHLRVLGERERWNVDVLLRMLSALLPFVQQKAIETCPFTSSLHPEGEDKKCISSSLLKLYATGHMEWATFEWMHVECLPNLIKLACLLPQKEDNLRTRISKYLLNVTHHYGRDYLEHIMLPVFLAAVGDNDSDFSFFPLDTKSKIEGLRPRDALHERLAVMCVLPLLLSGILGSPSCRQKLEEYLRKILVETTKEGSWSVTCTAELIDAVRFLCTFQEHHGIIFNILWEMVVSSDINMKTNAASLLKILVPYIDVKTASTHALPALVTLGSDQNLAVKYASIDAFGAVAQQFKSEMIVEKICVQMDAFLDDGSHEATVSVVRALTVSVPHTTDRLREYLLSKIVKLTGIPSSGKDIARRRERANVFCEAIRSLDATDLPNATARDLLITSIQNLLKDADVLDPAHKEALELIAKERSGGAFEGISKVMGAHLGLASSVSSFFGESKILGKKEVVEPLEQIVPTQPTPQSQQEDTGFRRMMMSGFGDMLRGKAKAPEESS